MNTAGEIAKPEVWPSFLTTACHNFRLSFDKQVLLYAQRPDATAVLPIEGKHGWNQKFGRWVNRGSKGIALFDSDRNGVATLKYYFDISDTYEGRYPRPVPIWSVRPEFEQGILETLENSFGDLPAKDTLSSGLISAAQNIVEDNISDYLEQLMYYREGSFLEPLDDESITSKGTMDKENSVVRKYLAQRADLVGAIRLPNNVLFKAIMDTPFENKPVIVLDEFQYLGKANPAFPSIFQRIWEEILKDKSVMVILCGSLISMMESQTLAYGSPLYGRRTAQIRLKQIPFGYYHEFFPSKSRKELIEMYAVTGGVPKYIELFSESKDIYSAIQKCVLNRSGYLYDEPHFLLQQEVSEVGSYFSIIKAIAAGNSKLSAISSILEIKSTSLTKYLKTLIDLDILEREVPITEENPEKSKKGLYKIKDNYLRFWFAFVYPNDVFATKAACRNTSCFFMPGFIFGMYQPFDPEGERICNIPASIAFWGQKAACQGRSPLKPLKERTTL